MISSSAKRSQRGRRDVVVLEEFSDVAFLTAAPNACARLWPTTRAWRNRFAECGFAVDRALLLVVVVPRPMRRLRRLLDDCGRP